MKGRQTVLVIAGIAVLWYFAWLGSKVGDAADNAFRAYDAASDASMYCRKVAE